MSRRAQKFTINTPELKERLIRFLKASDVVKHPIDVEIKPHTKRRSNNQNALYWKWIEGVVSIVQQETGNSKEGIHASFKEMFLEPEITTLGNHVSRRWTTTNLSTAEMSRYMDQIYAFVVSELGIMLPIPEEMHQREDA